MPKLSRRTRIISGVIASLLGIFLMKPVFMAEWVPWLGMALLAGGIVAVLNPRRVLGP